MSEHHFNDKVGEVLFVISEQTTMLDRFTVNLLGVIFYYVVCAALIYVVELTIRYVLTRHGPIHQPLRAADESETP